MKISRRCLKDFSKISRDCHIRWFIPALFRHSHAIPAFQCHSKVIPSSSSHFEPIPSFHPHPLSSFVIPKSSLHFTIILCRPLPSLCCHVIPMSFPSIRSIQCEVWWVSWAHIAQLQAWLKRLTCCFRSNNISWNVWETMHYAFLEKEGQKCLTLNSCFCMDFHRKIVKFCTKVS